MDRLVKKIFFILVLVQSSLITYGQIIADHTVVDNYDKIPQYYIDKVKKMWLVIAGESHAWAYFEGLELLESLNPVYASRVSSAGEPPGYTNEYLRNSPATWGDYANSTGWIYDYGEEDWFTNSTGISRTKAGITYCNTHDLIISAIGFGWCYDALRGSATLNSDPIFGIHWYGSSNGSTGGDMAWGIDDSDYSVTGNEISMDTYLSVTQEYIDYCTTNGYQTKVFFTTGPVDSYTGESGYQGYLKYEHIRDYVKTDPTRILFDYADILCYDDDGTLTTTTWNGHVYPIITLKNVTPTTTGHISGTGAVRLAKAIWWLLARIAGWDGENIATSTDNLKEEPVSSVIEKTPYEIRIKLTEQTHNATVRLYNYQGSQLIEKKVNDIFCTINITDLPAGLYLVAVSAPGFIRTHKIVLP